MNTNQQAKNTVKGKQGNKDGSNAEMDFGQKDGGENIN